MDEIFRERISLCAEIDECNLSAGHCSIIAFVLLVAAIIFMLLSFWAIGGTLMAVGAIFGFVSFVLFARMKHLCRKLSRMRVGGEEVDA